MIRLAAGTSLFFYGGIFHVVCAISGTASSAQVLLYTVGAALFILGALLFGVLDPEAYHHPPHEQEYLARHPEMTSTFFPLTLDQIAVRREWGRIMGELGCISMLYSALRPFL